MIDDKLSPVDRLVKYINSRIGLQRLVHVKLLGDVAVDVGYEITIQKIIPLFNTIIKDPELSIRQHFAMQLGSFAKV